MKTINIGSKIAKKRKEKGVTQEELAEFVGVSKAAVSKWESGQSYPDILILPVLATFFDTSVDDILNYEPQMAKSDIKNLYARLAKDFAAKPYNDVYDECISYSKKYFSCWELQFHIGLILLNHIEIADDKDKIFKEVEEIFKRVANESNDFNLHKQSLCLQALCMLSTNRPESVIDLLGDIPESITSHESLLARAYSMRGTTDKAISILQKTSYMYLNQAIANLSDLMLLYSDKPEKFNICLDKIIDLGNVFEFNTMHPSSYLSIYLPAAQVYIMQQNNDAALDMLEKYVDIISSPNTFPLKLQGNEFFDSLDEFFNSLTLGSDMPRDEKTVKQSIKDCIISNPVFDVLKSNTRYLSLVNRLENALN